MKFLSVYSEFKVALFKIYFKYFWHFMFLKILSCTRIHILSRIVLNQKKIEGFDYYIEHYYLLFQNC